MAAKAWIILGDGFTEQTVILKVMLQAHEQGAIDSVVKPPQ